MSVLSCDYRAAGTAAPPGSLELEHNLRSQFEPAFADGLTLVLGQDPTVYILRRVACELTVRAAENGLPNVARRLGNAAANAVLRTITIGSRPDVITFRDETEFVTQFVVDLLEGRATSRWYYEAFAGALQKSRPEALAEVLLGAGMVALGRLHARGYLEQVLRYLPATVVAEIAGGDPIAPEATLRPLLAAAHALCAGLLVPPTHALEELLHDYATTQPASPDWRDRGSLSDGVLDALRFLLRRHALRLTGAAALAHLADGTRGLDWLDVEALRDGIWRLTLQPARPRAPDGQLVPRGGAPRGAQQRALLRDLAEVCALGWPMLDRDHGDTPGNRVRMMSALVAHSERWAGNPVASELVAALLRELAGQGNVDRPLLRELASIGSAPANDALASRDERGQVSQAGILPRGEHGQVSDSEIRIEHAGVLLLVRAGLELRLNELAGAAGFLEPGEALPTVLLSFADARSPGPGLAEVLAAPISLNREYSEEARQAFESAELNALAARGLLGGQPCFHHLEERGAAVLLAGLKQPEVWPLTQAVADNGEVELTLARWQTEWSAATGAPADAFCPAGDTTSPARLLSRPTSRIPADGTKLTIAAAGLVLVRVWGRWLPGLAHSSLRYLLEHFIRRPGTVRRDGEALVVTLDRGPLDVVLVLSGALAEIDARRALGVTIRFEASPP